MYFYTHIDQMTQLRLLLALPVFEKVIRNLDQPSKELRES